VNIDGRDVVRTIRPCPASLIDARKYRDALRSKLYPWPQGIEVVFRTTAANRGLLGIRIPRQPVENLPILVRGMPDSRGGRSEGAYIGLFRRYSDNNLPIDIAAVHAYLNRLFG
jgi:hypothetical protein